MTRLRLVLAVLLFIGLRTPPLRAEVVRVDIDRRADVLDGRPFGAAGAYEKLSGTVHFEFDPDNPLNARIVDLALAPRNDRGNVEAKANFMVLKPKDPSKSNGVGYVEVSNRGGKATLRYFQSATGRPADGDPVDAAHFGDGLLMNMGVTIIWVGWQFDVPDGSGRLRLDAPIATNPNGSIVTGLARSDWVVEEAVDTLELAHRGHIPYPVVDPMDPVNRLTMRRGRLEPRFEMMRDIWRFGVREDGQFKRDLTRITLESGFQPDLIYELVYRAADPHIVGLGLAAIRDMASYAKYYPNCPFPVDHVVAFGVSQTGRFLRHFLYQGFNTDELERKVYDGLLIHSAGAGRGSFNHRFAQPSRDAHRYSAFTYPTDIFPFTSRTQRDPETGIEDGLLAHAFDDASLPKIFYTNTGYEYWGRSAALIHMSVEGYEDVEPLDNERIYHLASGQHFVSPFPPQDRNRIQESDAYQGNPLDFLVTLRALLVNLINWVVDDEAPPPSQYPHIQDRTLVPLELYSFPEIPGVEAPAVAQEAYRVDYGPRWKEGIIDHQPPKLGSAYPTNVPGVDEFGNELGGVLTVEIMVPLATYAPWCLRHGAAVNPQELKDFYGTYIPLPRTEQERERTDDPRPSIELRYHDRDNYLNEATKAADMLIDRGLLLAQDRQRVIDRAGAQWDWIHARPGE